MPKYKNIFPVDLANGEALRVSVGTLHQGDKYANRIGAVVTENGAPVNLGGSCSAVAILSSGVTVPMTNGVVNNNQIYCDLIDSCYAVEGPIGIKIKWTNGSERATILSAYGYVSISDTDTPIDPGNIIPSVEDLIDALEAAKASIPQDYSTLSGNVTTLMSDVSDLQTADIGIKSALAKNYAYMTFPIAKGEYRLYQGALFKATQDIPTSEAWTAAHWEMAVLGEDLADVGQQMTDIAPIFSASAAYEAGDLVRYGGLLYRANQSHSGAWDAYHFSRACLADGVKATIGGNNALCLVGPEKSGSRLVSQRVGDALMDHVGETISVSFDLKASIARQIMVYAYQSTGYSIEDTFYFTPSTTEFTRFSFATKVKNYGNEGGYSHNGAIGIFDATDENTIYVKNFKVESGAVSTPFSMSAQDAFEQAIQSLDIASVSEVKAYLGID